MIKQYQGDKISLEEKILNIIENILIEYFKQLYEGKISKDDYFEYTEADNVSGMNFGIIKNFDYGLKCRQSSLKGR